MDIRNPLRYLMRLNSQYAKQKACNQANDTHSPYPQEAGLNMIFDLNSCKADSQECGRYNRANERCAVSADHHGDRNMGRIYTKFVSYTNQYRKQTVEIGIRTEQ